MRNPRLITGPTVWVLGAGASAHADVPLLNDFLVAARYLHYSRSSLHHARSFSDLFSWLDSLRAASYYVDLDLDNLEHVFSILEMQAQLGLTYARERSDDIAFVIQETIDNCTLKFGNGGWQPDPIYFRLFDYLDEFLKTRLQAAEQPSIATLPDSIITFNYDIFADNALIARGREIEYGIKQDLGDGQRLFKLHGSTNWGRCRSQCPGVQIVPARYATGIGAQLPTPTEGQPIALQMTTRIMPGCSCRSCGKTDVLVPAMIPPTWSKRIADTGIRYVWAHAIEALREASQIVVAGYSMPPTDTFFKYLLAIGLQRNSHLLRVVVVNPDRSEHFVGRYRNVFSRSLHERGRLEFVHEPFARFVSTGMIGSLAQFP